MSARCRERSSKSRTNQSLAHTPCRADHGRPPARRQPSDAITGSAVNHSARKDWWMWMRSGRRTDPSRPGITRIPTSLAPRHTSTRPGSKRGCHRGVRADRPEQADRRRVTCVEREEVAGSTGLEPAASGVTGRRSNQLNYDPAKTFECNPNDAAGSSRGRSKPRIAPAGDGPKGCRRVHAGLCRPANERPEGVSWLGGTGLEPVTTGV